MRYPIILEPTATGFSAYVPELPGCIATAATEREARRLIAEAIALHLAGIREDRRRRLV